MPVDQERWHDACLAYYRDGDSASREAVHYFDLTVAGDNQGLGSPNLLLSCIGLDDPSGLTPEELKQSVQTKNLARSEAHKQVTGPAK